MAEHEAALTTAVVESIGSRSRDPDWLMDRRREALAIFHGLPMPRSTDEEWRRSSLSRWDLSGLQFIDSEKQTKPKKAPASLTRAPLDGDWAGQWIVEGDSPTRGHLDARARSAGVWMAPLAQAAREHADLVQPWLGKIIPAGGGKFESLASAVAHAGLVLYIPRGVRLERPLHTLAWTAGAGTRSQRLLVIIEEDAGLSLLHENAYAGSRSRDLQLELIEVVVKSGGSFRFVQVHNGNGAAWGFSRARAVVEAGASLDWQFAILGDAACRIMLAMDLAGAGASGRMAGLYGAAGEQHVECISLQTHAAPHTTSDFLYKGAVTDAARSTWRGMVRMEPQALGADGYQANRNLLLSDAARAESLPGLEILADDIRCSHGATVGSLDPDELFYLQTRGLPEEDARRELATGFYEPVISRFPWKALQKRLRLALGSRPVARKQENEDNQRGNGDHFHSRKGGIPGKPGNTE